MKGKRDNMQFKHSPHVMDLIIVSTCGDDVKLVILACFLTHHSLNRLFLDCCVCA